MRIESQPSSASEESAVAVSSIPMLSLLLRCFSLRRAAVVHTLLPQRPKYRSSSSDSYPGSAYTLSLTFVESSETQL